MGSVTTPAALLQAAFPDDVLEVLRRLKGAGHKAFLVGGLVRDQLLGRSGGDYDVATSALAEQVIKLFRKVIPTGLQHGTVTVLMKREKVEVTTFRGEGAYADGRRPDSVVFLDNVVEDLARRDFTINAMAWDPIDREFVDPFGGALDLQARIVRCVGVAHDRFSEDGLRPLRAVRFASVLDFEIEPATRDAIPATLGTFAKIARERVREELTKTLVGPRPGKGIRLLRETALLEQILPELDSGTLAFAYALGRLDASEPQVELRYAALLWQIPPDAALTALERLRHPRAVIDTTVALLRDRTFALESYPSDASLRRALSRVSVRLVPQLLSLGTAQVRALSDEEGSRSVLDLTARIAQVLATKPPLTTGELALNGKAVMQILGSVPGPKVGQALRFLLDQVLEDPSLNTVGALEQRVRDWAVPNP